ncbi:protein of unknown function [Azospirillum lipoferum 4B]|uniref:Uncharacterized protein n=1 Tax=Azospirillum lipoferum (strain 4B) TaxID=862719 RepID=G7Z8L9_AZOL4|nr:protein of unknown function [Azospirillum lipoferum 4B]
MFALRISNKRLRISARRPCCTAVKGAAESAGFDNNGDRLALVTGVRRRVLGKNVLRECVFEFREP